MFTQQHTLRTSMELATQKAIISLLWIEGIKAQLTAPGATKAKCLMVSGKSKSKSHLHPLCRLLPVWFI